MDAEGSLEAPANLEPRHKCKGHSNTPTKAPSEARSNP